MPSQHPAATQDGPALPANYKRSVVAETKQNQHERMTLMILSTLDPTLKKRGLDIARDLKTMADIVDFRAGSYSEHYPDVKHHGPDLFDLNGIILFSRKPAGDISTTARIAFDGCCGLPSESLLHPFIAQLRTTETLCEIGKFIIDGEHISPQLHDYFRAFYLIGSLHRLVFTFLVPEKHGQFYVNHVGAKLVQRETGQTFGSVDNFSIFIWKPAESTRRFKKWIGIEEQAS
jgi:hypothetical protein